MAKVLWTQIDTEIEGKPYHLAAGDVCFFTREYVSSGGYAASETNQLVSNFKKDPSRRSKTKEWYWKEKAAEKFAYELSLVLFEDAVIATIPTSKPRGHPAYDDRFEMMLTALRRLRKDIRVEEPVIRTQECQCLHHGAKRSIREVSKTLAWNGLRAPTSELVLIDDVITCGTSFKACEAIILQNVPHMEIGGLFWARTVWPYEDPPEDDGLPDI